MGLGDILSCNFNTNMWYNDCRAQKRAESSNNDAQTAKAGQKDGGTKETSLGAKIAVDANNNIEVHNSRLEDAMNLH